MSDNVYLSFGEPEVISKGVTNYSVNYCKDVLKESTVLLCSIEKGENLVYVAQGLDSLPKGTLYLSSDNFYSDTVKILDIDLDTSTITVSSKARKSIETVEISVFEQTTLEFPKKLNVEICQLKDTYSTRIYLGDTPKGNKVIFDSVKFH